MYKVYCDGVAIYDLTSPYLVLLEPVLQLELNSPGSFEFTIPLDHPYFDLPQKMTSRIWVVKDDEEIFRGRVIEEEIDWYKRKKIYCEGELAYLNDSVQRPAEYHDMSVRDYFATLIDNHNAQVEADKQFEMGYVLVEDTNDSLYRYTNYNSTLTEMKEDLVDDLGGYIRVRNESGHKYLDYINVEDYGVTNDQAIRFGINLLDYSQTMDVSDIATVLIPLGKRLDESPIEALDMRLTVESVNGGSDAIESEEAVKTFGRIVKTIIWDDVTLPENLLKKGQKYLSDYQWDALVLDVTPVDLHDSDPNTDTFHLGDQLRVISSPHGLDRYFPLSAMTVHLDAPDQNTFTLGLEDSGKTITGNINTTIDNIKQVEDSITPTQMILNSAKEQASNLINAATHGYVVLQPNDEPEEILIMDTPSFDTATQIWRWNMGGLGYGTREDIRDDFYYKTAMTMDGQIVADFITTGQLTANVIYGGTIQDVAKNNIWNLDSGELTTKNITATGGTIGGWSITASRIRSSAGVSIHGGTAGLLLINEENKPYLDAEDTKGNTTFSIDRDGTATFAGKLSAATGTFAGELSAASGSFSGTITATSGSIGGWLIASGKIYNDLDKYEKAAAFQAPTSSNTIVLAIGGSTHSSYTRAPFRVDKDGNMTAESGTFKGELDAASGTFKGELSGATGTFKGELSAATGTFSGKLSAVTGTFEKLYTGDHSSYSSSEDGFFAGSKGISLGDNFKVSADGTMTAKEGKFYGTLKGADGTFSGELSAVSGTFSSIYTGSHSSYSSTSSGVYAGSSGLSVGRYFSVSSTGVMTCSSGTFSGKLSAATGSFSGDISAASGTFTGTVTSSSGSYKTSVTSGRVYFYYSSSVRGYLSGHSSGSWGYGIRVAGSGHIALLASSLVVGGYASAGSSATCYEGTTGSQQYIYNIVSNSGGGITWYWHTATFRKGLCTSLS